jgi:hypothetical protein
VGKIETTTKLPVAKTETTMKLPVAKTETTTKLPVAKTETTTKLTEKMNSFGIRCSTACSCSRVSPSADEAVLAYPAVAEEVVHRSEEQLLLVMELQGVLVAVEGELHGVVVAVEEELQAEVLVEEQLQAA